MTVYISDPDFTLHLGDVPDYAELAAGRLSQLSLLAEEGAA